MNPALRLCDTDDERHPPSRDRIGSVEEILADDIRGEEHDGYDIYINPDRTATRALDMLLTQHPITTLAYHLNEDQEDRISLTYRAEGIRLGDLLVEQRRFLQRFAELQGYPFPVQSWSFGFRDDDNVKGREGESLSGKNGSGGRKSGEDEDDTKEAGEEEDKRNDDKEDESWAGEPQAAS